MTAAAKHDDDAMKVRVVKTKARDDDDHGDLDKARDSGSSASDPSASAAAVAGAGSSKSKAAARTTAKRKKVTLACVYCRRSHMTCDEGRPCQRCIKRNIGHLCRDEQRPATTSANVSSVTTTTMSGQNPLGLHVLASPTGGPPGAFPAANVPLGLASGVAAGPTMPSAQSVLASRPSLPGYDLSGANADASGAVPGSLSSFNYARFNPRPLGSTAPQNRPPLSPLRMIPSNAMNQTLSGPSMSTVVSPGAPPGSSKASSTSPMSFDPSARPGDFVTSGAQATALGTIPNSGTNNDAVGSALNQSVVGGSLMPGADDTDLTAYLLGNNLSGNFTGLPMGGLTPLPFASELAINEFTVISDFLEHFDNVRPAAGATFASYPQLGTTPQNLSPQGVGGLGQAQDGTMFQSSNGDAMPDTDPQQASSNQNATDERYLMKVADPCAPSVEDRLKEVINAKYEAGFLRPFNYVNGYTRLSKYMESNMRPTSRTRILNAVSHIRPAFRTVAQSLSDVDLVLVEEMFERLLLDYDHLFSAMGIPACLWRRTGEIFKANHPFADLVGIPLSQLRDGRTTIYELMAEDSAVNYWEKYGGIAFDPGQKAVLTSCVLTGANTNRASIPCCFSFTIRRDRYNIPIMVVGNFLPSEPANLAGPFSSSTGTALVPISSGTTSPA